MVGPWVETTSCASQSIHAPLTDSTAATTTTCSHHKASLPHTASAGPQQQYSVSGGSTPNPTGSTQQLCKLLHGPAHHQDHLQLPSTTTTRFLAPAVAAAPASLQINGCCRVMVNESSYCQRFGICNEHIKADRVPVQGVDCRWADACCSASKG